VSVVPLDAPVCVVAHLPEDVRPARRVRDGWELRGPAAPELARYCQPAVEGEPV
jgi:hypothetical protein